MKVTKRLLGELRANAKKCGQSLSQYCIGLLSGRHPRAAFSEEEWQKKKKRVSSKTMLADSIQYRD